MTGIKGRRWGADVYLDPSIDVGAIPYKGANGQLLWLTPGAAGQVITSNGVSPSIPSYQTPSGGVGGGAGALVLLGTYTAASSATLDIVTRNASGQSGAIFQSDYPVYVMEVINLLPATNAVEIRARVSTNGGSSFITTTSYGHACLRWIAGGSGVAGANASETYISIYGGENVDPMSNTASAGGLCGTYKIYSPTSSSVKKRITGQTTWLNSGGNNNGATIAAYYDATTAIDAFQFYASSGNLASGSVKIYGVV